MIEVTQPISKYLMMVAIQQFDWPNTSQLQQHHCGYTTARAGQGML
jgi:hypothetical protein